MVDVWDLWRLTVWGETLELKGVPADGKLTLRVKDYDTFGSDDDIGELVISMDDVKAQMSREGSKACWKKLSGVGAGDGELCVGFEVEGGGETKASSSSLGSSSDSACCAPDMMGADTGQTPENADFFGNSMSAEDRDSKDNDSAFVIHVLRARDLTPSADIGSLDPFVEVSVGANVVRTKVVQDCTDPGRW